MADSSLDEYIKANKIKPNRSGGAKVNKAPKKQGQKKVMNGKQGGVKKAKKTQNGATKPMRGQAKRGRGSTRGNWRPRAATTVARSFQPAASLQTGPAKVQISNLDFGVSDQDIKELFSEFGSLKSASIHYNAQGKSMGVAHLVYGRHADAMKAVKQYNGVALDGRTMKLKLEGQQGTSLAARVAFTSVARGVKRLNRGAAQVGRSRGGQRGSFRGRGGARGRGAVRGNNSVRRQGTTRGRGGAKRGRGGRGGKQANKKKPLTAEQLDAQLDAYIKTKA